MPFGNHSTTEDRIWSFKAKPPEAGELRGYLGTRMHDAYVYRKTLVELEWRRRDEVNAVLDKFDPSISVKEKALKVAKAEKAECEKMIKEKNQQARARVATKEDREQKRKATAEVARLGKALKEAKDLAFADAGVKAQLEVIEGRHRADWNAATQSSPLRWDTKDFIKQTRSGDRKGPPPKPVRWTEEQMLAFRLKEPITWEGALAGVDPRLKIEILPPGPGADPESRRSRVKHRAIVTFRVAEKEVAARVTVHLHRQPPPDTRIKYLYLHRHLVGRRHTWELQFVLGRDSWPRDDQARSGACGVDLGWRLVPGGMRVAYAVGSDGAEHILTLPGEMLDAWEKVEDLQAIRDKNFDAIRDRLVAWVAMYKPLLTRWHLEELGYARKRDATRKADDQPRSKQHLGQWKSPEALSWVVRHWRDRRFEGDEHIFEELEAWRKQNRHLYDWQTGQRRQVIRRRDDLYRKFARRLARLYRAAKLRAINYRELKGRPAPDESDSKRQARLNAHNAAPGRLAQLIREAVTEPGKVPVEHPVGACSRCGTLDDYDRASELVHACSKCGAEWDQDRNAALNLLGWEPPADDEGDDPGAGDLRGHEAA
jgi:hypothetical protein